MANEWVCMGCMQANSEFSDTCYHCGYPATGQNPAEYLPVRTQLNARYVIGRVLEKRSDAVIYIGYDQTARNTVLVREFFPDGIAQRLSQQVVAADGKDELFAACLDKFRKQSRAIARMRDLPALVPVYDMFEENGTMYTVSDHVEGVTLRAYLQKSGEYMSWEAARPLFVPLLSSVMSLHAAGLVHLGISPDTIVVDGENRLRLGGWELNDARVSGGALAPTMIAGYAAPEQYKPETTVGQSADVYALGATILFALTGEEPPAAPDRVNKVASLLVPAPIAQKWPAHIAPSLSAALALSTSKRLSSVEELRDRLTVAPVVEALREDAMEEEADDDAAVLLPARNKGLKIAVVMLSVLCVILLVVILLMALWGSDEPTVPTGGDTAQTTTTTVIPTTTTRPVTSTTKGNTEEMYAVEDLIGLTIDELQSHSLRGNMQIVIKGTEFSDTVPVGTVVMQSPTPETYVAEGTTVNVYVSAGPAEKTMLDIVGWERAAAVAYLEAMGYDVSVVEVTVSTQKRGTVHAVIPAPGATMTFGDEVVLQISMVPPVTITTTRRTTTTTTAATTTPPTTTTTSEATEATTADV